MSQNYEFAELSVKKMDPEAKLPTRANSDDAGLDLHALEDVILGAGQGKKIRTGIAMAIRPGFVGLVADRSSLAARGLKTAGGVIDAGYRGELQVVLWNLSGMEQRVGRGERVAQLLILPIATPVPKEVDTLTVSARGDGGFGSTGK
jgi:dUTP pyrophosphatase